MKRIALCFAILLLLVIAVPVVYFATVDLDDFQDPFLNAARDGDITAITVLIANGTDPNKSDTYGNTALSIAGHFGQTDVVDLLLKNGANIDGISGEMTPLQCAIVGRHPKTAAFLLQNNADPNIADDSGITPLATAARNGDTVFVKLLLDSGANIEQADKYGWRPLHVAIRSTQCSESGRLATVTVLLEYGADPNAMNPGGFERDGEHDSHLGSRPATLPNQGNTPLAIARSNGFKTITAQLLERGAQ